MAGERNAINRIFAKNKTGIIIFSKSSMAHTEPLYVKMNEPKH